MYIYIYICLYVCVCVFVLYTYLSLALSVLMDASISQPKSLWYRLITSCIHAAMPLFHVFLAGEVLALRTGLGELDEGLLTCINDSQKMARPQNPLIKHH